MLQPGEAAPAGLTIVLRWRGLGAGPALRGV